MHDNDVNPMESRWEFITNKKTRHEKKTSGTLNAFMWIIGRRWPIGPLMMIMMMMMMTIGKTTK